MTRFTKPTFGSKCRIPIGILALIFLTVLLASCGSTRMAENLSYISTQRDVAPTDDDRLETRNAEVCTFTIGTIPLSESPTALLAYKKLSEDAKYVNNVGFAQTSFEFYIFGKQCWIASGTAVLR